MGNTMVIIYGNSHRALEEIAKGTGTVLLTVTLTCMQRANMHIQRAIVHRKVVVVTVWRV